MHESKKCKGPFRHNLNYIQNRGVAAGSTYLHAEKKTLSLLFCMYFKESTGSLTKTSTTLLRSLNHLLFEWEHLHLPGSAAHPTLLEHLVVTTPIFIHFSLSGDYALETCALSVYA